MCSELSAPELLLHWAGLGIEVSPFSYQGDCF